ncbi:Rac GTPase-activating protein 1 [Trichoplax sp. H2]|nr:Rac GTPase-activating protein 1 [Trichoplax sp. H2]|eukprot:RDD38632.1 Rac GTPase-activating protein 1 [Trichoplax sp. H2]
MSSLLSKFDEITRISAILAEGNEEDFYNFAKNQEECRVRWLKAEGEVENLQQAYKMVKSDRETYDIKLKHIRNQLQIEMDRRKEAEEEIRNWEMQMTLIREILCDPKCTGLLSEEDRRKIQSLGSSQQRPSPRQSVSFTSVLSPSDISFDNTIDDLEAYSRRSNKFNKRKAPSAPPEPLVEEPPLKKSCSPVHEIQSESTSTESDAFPKVSPKPMPRNLSRPPSHSQARPPVDSFFGTSIPGDSPDVKRRLERNPTNGSVTSIQSLGTPTSSRLNRIHTFCSKTIYKPENCTVCSKRIKFGKVVFKCKDCKAIAHPDCKDSVPLPCVPVANTPQRSNSKKVKMEGIIADFTPSSAPMIPAIVIHCIQEVERRGLTEVGIYRVPGVEKAVKELKEKFLRGRGAPCLTNIQDIHIVCCVLKDFLRNLKEPIITFKLHPEFIKAAEMSDPDQNVRATYATIKKLPQPNRDTLALVMLHLQRVAATPECKMGTNNLARVFGPTLIGHGSSNPDPVDMLQDTRNQPKVIESLMSLPSEFWNQYVDIDGTENGTSNTNTERNKTPLSEANAPKSRSTTPRTPQSKEAPASILGPAHFTPGRSTGTKSKENVKTTPRFGSKSKRANKRPDAFFASPFLK